MHAALAVPGHACLSAQAGGSTSSDFSSASSCFLNPYRAAPTSCIFQLYFDCGFVIGVILQGSGLPPGYALESADFQRTPRGSWIKQAPVRGIRLYMARGFGFCPGSSYRVIQNTASSKQVSGACRTAFRNGSVTELSGKIRTELTDFASRGEPVTKRPIL